MILLIEGYPGILSKNEIAKIFNRYGSIEKVEKERGRNRAMVVMTDDHQAEKAIKELDGSKIFGRVVRVSKRVQ